MMTDKKPIAPVEFDPNKPFVAVSSNAATEESTPEFDPNQAFTPVKKKDNTDVSHKPSGQDSEEPAKPSGENSEERNPFVTFGKKTYSTLVNQVAPNTSLAIQALINQGLETIEYGASKVPGLKNVDEFLTKTVGEIPTLSKVHADYLLKDAVLFANERGKADQKLTKDLVNSYTQIHDITSAANWATGALSQTAAQIIPAIVTGGASAAGQEIGSIYLDAVNQTAEKMNLTPSEVIEKGLDEKAIAIAAGFGAGALDLLGAKGVAGAFSKSPAGKAFKSKMLQFLNSAPVKEAWTEGVQTVIEHAGSAASTKKGLGENIKNVSAELSKPETAQDIKESMAQGFVGAHGIGVIGKVLTPKDVIREEKATIRSTDDVAGAEKAAEVIQEKINNQPTEEAPNDSQSGTRISGEERVGQEPVQAGVEQGGSSQAPSPSGVVQSPQEEQKVEPTKQKVFIYGTLTDARTRKKALGEHVDTVPHIVEGLSSDDGTFATLKPGEKVKGEVMEVTPEQLAKLDKYEEKYDRKEIQPGVFAYIRKPNVTRKGEVFTNEQIRVAKEYAQESRNPSMTPEENMIADEIGNKGVNTRSIEKGVEHEVTPAIKKSYFSKEGGRDIDEIAQAASLSLNPKGDGTEITPQMVWDFMKKFPQGGGSMSTPKGNQRLMELSNQYMALTGKAINRKIAKDISNSLSESLGNEDANSKLSGLFDEQGNLDDVKLAAEFDKDPEAFKKSHGLSDQEFDEFKRGIHERQGQRNEGEREGSRSDQRAEDQGRNQPSQGGPLSQEFGNKSQSPTQFAEEIKAQNLTRAEGLGMGKGLAAGTYVSTEKSGNRYADGKKVNVSIRSPFVFLNENLIIPFRNQVLNDNFDLFGEEDFEGDPFSDKKTIEGLTFKGIEKLADLVKEKLQKEGYDSIYLPETDTQEGELIVFDKENVHAVESGPHQIEAQKRIEKAQAAVTAAQKAFDDKKDKMAKSLKEDQMDIFGNRTGNQGQLLDAGAINMGQVKLKLDEAERTVTEARQELEAAQQAMSLAEKADQNDLFSQPKETETPPPPPPPEQPETTEQPLGPEQGVRETVKKLEEESNLAEPLKEAITDFENYDKRKRSQTQFEARRTIEKLGEDEALASATSFKAGRTQEQKIALLSELAERFNTQFRNSTDEKARNAAYDKFMRAMKVLAENITDTAQALSYMNLVGQMFETKAGAVRVATRQIEESREGALKNYDALKMNAHDILAEIDKLTREELLKSKAVQEILKEAQKNQPRVVITKEKRKQISDFFDKLKVDTSNKGMMSASVIPGLTLLPHVWNGSVEVIKQAVLAGADLTNAIQAGVDYIKKNHGEFDEKKYREGMTPLVQKVIPKTEGETELQKKKEAIVKKYLPKEGKKEAKQKKEFYDKVIELSNSGAVSDDQMNDEIAKIFGLPQMTPQIVERINQLVDDINKAPVGRFKNIAITKLTDYIAQQQRFNPTDYILASYKAGIFSGIDTQLLNNTGNLFNVLELGFALGFKNPMATARFYKAFANPKSLDKSIAEAVQVLKTGFDPRAIGDNRRALEQRPRSFFGLGKPLEGWRQALDPSLEQQKKYVFRALSAGDLLFSTGINEALQNELYTREANRQGLHGKEATKYVMEHLGYTPENIRRMGEQAKKEATSGAIPNDKTSITLRTYELIEQQRDPAIVQKARQYASEQIMTNTPRGYIGIAARSLNNFIHKVPVISAFIPVVNFAANAMSRAVQYMPQTVLIREAAHDIAKMTKGQSWRSIQQEKMKNLREGDFDSEMRLRRAAIGFTSMALMMALLGDDEDDENILSNLLGKKIKIHGFGPGSQLNRQKNYQLQESGWLPYSIQIGDKYFSYRNYPAINVLLATMGEYNDAIRYGKLNKNTAAQRMVFAMGASFRVIAEMGFLTSLNTLISALLEGDAKSIKNLVDVPSRSIQGFAFPKFQRNLTNLFDNKIYSGNDINTLITRGLPVVNSYTNQPLVNALGEPIEKNWWDRVALWNESSYSKYSPIWKANNEKKYFFTVPSRFALEKKFGGVPLTDKQYNDYFRLRGEQIIKEWTPELANLSTEDYAEKMDKMVQYADYKALVNMGVMKSNVMKDINHQLESVQEIKKKMQGIRKQTNPMK